MSEPIDFAALRAAAEAATPGEWEAVYPLEMPAFVRWAGKASGGYEYVQIVGRFDPRATVNSDANAAYIAAFNPVTAVRLLDALAA